MRLQLRVRHSLGARMVEVEGRDASAPLLIGRDPSADVQVPTGTVSPHHCQIWEEDGQFFIQDVGSERGTLVNGQPIGQEAAYLRFGDTITLGDGTAAPTVEVDPQGVARRALRRPATATRAAEPSGPDSGAAYAAGFGAAPPQHWTPPAAPGRGSDPAPDGVPADEVTAAASSYLGHDTPLHVDDDAYVALSAAEVSRARRRPARKDNSGTIAMAVGIGAVVVAVGAMVIYWAVRNSPGEQVIVQPAPKPNTPIHDELAGRSRKTGNIFDDTAAVGGASRAGSGSGGGAARPAPAPQRNVAPPPTTPSRVDTPLRRTTAPPPEQTEPEPTTPAPESTPATTPAQPVAAAGPMDEAWKEVLQARDTVLTPGRAISQYLRYQEDHPDAHQEELAEFVEEALDLLWWQRLAQLWKEREELNESIAKLEVELKQATDPQFKKDREAEKAPLVNTRDAKTRLIEEDMGYAEKAPPNESDLDQLATLRAKRDAAKYAGFRNRVLESIRKNRKYPWGPWS